MLVSHEVPLCLLEESEKFNDYDYALVHLLEKYPEYNEFYKSQVKKGRRVFLDNSAFELGASVDNHILLAGMREINPTHVIAPDFIDNKEKTLIKSKLFLKEAEEIGYNGRIIFVIQGSTYEEYVNCYIEYQQMMRKGDWIAIPFDIKCFEKEAERYALTKTQVYAYSRVILLNKMVEDGVIDYSTEHHLLGASDPIEFMAFTKDEETKKKFSFISSVDTSCPIILAMFGQNLQERGLGHEKLKPKLADNLEWTVPESFNQPTFKELLYNNVNTFRKYIGRAGDLV